jgi:hypothetical protein
MGTLEQVLIELVTMVDRPIINCLSTIKYLFISSSYVLHFEWFKMLRERYLKLWKSSLKCKEKGIMKKQTRRKISISTYKMCFFVVPFLFGPLLPSNLITFLFLTHFKWFKVIQERHLKFYKLSLNLNSNRATFKEFFGCLGTGKIIFEL